MPAPSLDRLVEIAIIGRPHGVRGELRVQLHYPSSDILERVDRVFLRPAGDDTTGTASYSIVGIRRGPHTALVTFDGVGDRDQAVRLKGARLLVPRSTLPRTAGDEFYVDDLIGLEVRHGGVRLGSISASREQGGIEVVTVALDGDPGGAEELEIPLVEDYVARLSVAEGLVEVREIEDLPRNRAGRGRG